MRLGTIAFFAGVLIFHTLADLPSLWWGLALPGVVAIIATIPYLRLPAWCAAGFLWTLVWAGAAPQLQFATEWESLDLQTEGWIAAIPEPSYRSTRFHFQIDTLRHADVLIPFNGRLRLSWYNHPPALQVGDKWRFTVRLKRARGLANPGGFDYQRWLFASGIAAQGYIREYPEPRLLEQAARYPVDRFRQSVVERFSRLLLGSPYAGMLTALAVGEDQGIQPWQWEIFTLTGTGHLLSISGLHVGLIAGLVFVLARRLWGWVPFLLRRWPSSKAAALAALLGASGYALLAGMSLPTQRSLMMIAVAMLAVLWQRPIVASQILALALLVIVVMDPLAPLTGSFWLSFGAVAAILYTLVGRGKAVLRDWLGLQLAITLALLPATLILFGQIPLISPLANLIAIPWANITVIPLALLAVLAGFINETAQLELLTLASLSMDWLWRFLVWSAHWPWAVVQHPAPPLWILLLVLPGLLLLLAPAGTPRRWLGGVLCLPLWFFPKAAPAPETLWFTLLDVGQGLSAVIRTANHMLVYDTGPRRGENFDAGRIVLAPFLQHQNVTRVDALVISHADNEHMGGTRSLLERFKVASILTASPLRAPIEGAQPCQAGTQWSWDEVRFRILHPPMGEAFSGDNASCVLLIENRYGRVLLTGDIGAAAQSALVAAYGPELSVDVLVAPQQGAGELPSAGFVAAAQPRYVLFSSGYKNRFGFPKPDVVQRYREAGAVVMNTAEAGAITLRLDSKPLNPESYRQTARGYWYADR